MKRVEALAKQFKIDFSFSHYHKTQYVNEIGMQTHQTMLFSMLGHYRMKVAPMLTRRKTFYKKLNEQDLVLVNAATMSIFYFGRSHKFENHHETIAKLNELEENFKIKNPKHFEMFEDLMEKIRTTDVNCLNGVHIDFLVFSIMEEFRLIKQNKTADFVKDYEAIFWKKLKEENFEQKQIEHKIAIAINKLEEIYLQIE